MNGLAHFSSYVPATDRSYIQTTGPVESVPNATGGMHATRYSRPGVSGFMQDNFGATQTNWINGIPNEYIAGGAALLLVLVMMK